MLIKREINSEKHGRNVQRLHNCSNRLVISVGNCLTNLVLPKQWLLDSVYLLKKFNQLMEL